MKKILLLGSGELGKEFTISAKRMGFRVIACDSYANAPAMQVSDENMVFNMLDGEQLKNNILKADPDIIVPEVEAIRTKVLLDLENTGKLVVPSAKAVDFTMNRDQIRDLAKYLGLSTAKYFYAESKLDIENKIEICGFPCIIKPVMSSSGKGQKIIYNFNQISESWTYATNNMRGDRKKVIIEEFINFDSEITLLTVKQFDAATVFCMPIGHIQKDGDYQESWQPHNISTSLLNKAKFMAKVITDNLGGYGLYGVEFFIRGEEVIFSELSPRPHDTGMVTMFTQNLSQFDLHLRALMHLPIPNIKLIRPGNSIVIKADNNIEKASKYVIEGLEQALNLKDVDIRIFGKPTAYPNRRLGVIFADTKAKALKAKKFIKVLKSK